MLMSSANANTLPPHRPYDLKLNLEEGTSPPLGPTSPFTRAVVTERQWLATYVI